MRGKDKFAKNYLKKTPHTTNLSRTQAAGKYKLLKGLPNLRYLKYSSQQEETRQKIVLFKSPVFPQQSLMCHAG